MNNPDVICTPNIGDSPDERVSRKYKEVAEKICDALAQRQYNNSVMNAIYMPLALVPEMQPFLKLAEAMGRLEVQIVEDPVASVSIATDGGKDIDITTPRAKSLLQVAVLKGIVDCLKPQQSQTCSYVNAALLAADLNIRSQIGDLEGDKPRRTNGITVQVQTTSGKQHIIVGSVFGIEGRIDQSPRITQLICCKCKPLNHMSFEGRI